MLPLVSRGWHGVCERQASVLWHDVELLVTRYGERTGGGDFEIVDLCLDINNAAPLTWLAKRAPSVQRFKLGGKFCS